MKRRLSALFLSGSVVIVLGASVPDAVANPSASTASQKQAQDDSGSWDVPAGWNPATATAPTKPMPAAAMARVRLGG